MRGFYLPTESITSPYEKFRMSSQDHLFHEDWRDAIRHAVKAMGGFEAVGFDLWPTKTRKAAGIWLSDCLNPERPAKLDLDEIVKIHSLARDKGIHCAMHQLCDETRYVRPEIAPIKTKRQELAEKYQRLAQEMKRLADEEAACERAETMNEIRSVK